MFLSLLNYTKQPRNPHFHKARLVRKITVKREISKNVVYSSENNFYNTAVCASFASAPQTRVPKELEKLGNLFKKVPILFKKIPTLFFTKSEGISVSSISVGTHRHKQRIVRDMIVPGSVLLSLMFAWLPLTSNAGIIVTDSLQSSVLKTVRHFNVYLPNGYDADKNRRYPVLYLLHGLSDDHTTWTVRGGLKIVADELIGSGELVPLIIVMPEAGGQPVKEVWNGYYNMPDWPYETFFFEEFLPFIEHKYRIVGDKGHRAIAGLSMGGGGSVSYCQKHPEMFSSCYGFSSWLYQDISDDTRTKTDKLSRVNVAVHDNSCFKPIEEADDRVKQKLRTVKWFLDCGDDDYLLAQSERLHMLMRQAAIPCELRVRNGTHNWEYWHTGLRQSLPFASRNFEK